MQRVDDQRPNAKPRSKRKRKRKKKRKATNAGERGQAHTLEAFAAATILLASIVFALQVTAVTPLTASTSSQHIENQQESIAAGVLASAQENETLQQTLLYFNNSSGEYHNADETPAGNIDTEYVGAPPDTAFGNLLERTFTDQGIAFNLHVYYPTGEKNVERKTLVWNGGPSDNAVASSLTVTLYDDDRLYTESDPKDEPSGPTLASASRFQDNVPDQYAGSLYTVVEVEVVVWRM